MDREAGDIASMEPGKVISTESLREQRTRNKPIRKTYTSTRRKTPVRDLGYFEIDNFREKTKEELEDQTYKLFRTREKLPFCEKYFCEKGKTKKKCYLKQSLQGVYRHPDKKGSIKLNQELNEDFDKLKAKNKENEKC